MHYCVLKAHYSTFRKNGIREFYRIFICEQKEIQVRTEENTCVNRRKFMHEEKKIHGQTEEIRVYSEKNACRQLVSVLRGCLQAGVYWYWCEVS